MYILLLATTPCSDLVNECQAETTHTKSENQKHNHAQDDEDHCTPFCSCTCCTSGVTVATIKFSTIITKELNNEFSDKIKVPTQNFAFVSNFVGEIWQPPKI